MRDNQIKSDSHLQLVKLMKENSYSENKIDSICNLLKILGEPSRLKIVLALNKGALCVHHIVEAVNSNQSAVSHQLRILRDNKIIRFKREGQNIVYSLEDEHIMQIVNLAKIHVEE